jgi:hypothetical protein
MIEQAMEEWQKAIDRAVVDKIMNPNREAINLTNYGTKEVVITKTVTSCYHVCPHFSYSQDGMECGHPFWHGQNPYANMIISHSEDIQRGFPSKCPLFREGV